MTEIVEKSFVRTAGEWVESAPVQKVITALIVVNAAILGMETSPGIVAAIGPVLSAIDGAILLVFVGEIIARMAYRKASFFKDGWSLFDLSVVAIALVPTTPGLAVLRALRVLRVLRLITVLPRLKLIVGALLSSLPGLGMIMLLQGLLFYVGAVVSTKMFGASFPEWFGSLGASLYTLFQVMTLESWSMGIVRPVMEQYPYSWIFFIPFILIATFTMLNLFIAVIVNAMQTLHETDAALSETTGDDKDSDAVVEEIRNLRLEVAALRRALENGR